MKKKYEACTIFVTSPNTYLMFLFVVYALLESGTVKFYILFVNARHVFCLMQVINVGEQQFWYMEYGI